MKKLFVIILLVLVAKFAFCGSGKPSKCDQDTWQLVAEMYGVAIAYPNDFPNFIKNNNDKYAPGGQWQECAERLASQLYLSALSSFSPNQIEEHAMDVASRAGAPELGPKVAESMMSTSLDMARLASNLSSLTKSVSEIQKGNLYAYQNTEIYFLSSILWSAMQGLFTPEEIKSYQQIYYELSIWMILQYAQQIK